MKQLYVGLVIAVIAIYIGFFVVEVFIWMQPALHQRLLPSLVSSIDSSVPLETQARILRVLFINKGFYNLFIGLAGIVGLISWRRGAREAGNTLVGFMCMSAIAAGIVLAATTGNMLGAMAQILPAGLALALVRKASL